MVLFLSGTLLLAALCSFTTLAIIRLMLVTLYSDLEVGLRPASSCSTRRLSRALIKVKYAEGPLRCNTCHVEHKPDTWP